MKKSKLRNIVKLWERLELKYLDQDKEATFVTRVEDFEKNALITEKPVRIAGSLELKPGHQVEVAFNRDDATYSFQAMVVAIDEKRENIVTLKAISEISRSQRRRFVRIDVAGQVTFKTVEMSMGHGPEISLDKSGELLNISAGGVLLNSSTNLKRDNLVLLNFRLKNSQRLENVLGVVKRHEQVNDPQDSQSDYLTGIEFLTKNQATEKLTHDVTETLPSTVNFFDEALQQAIVQYVYKQQIQSRKQEKV